MVCLPCQRSAHLLCSPAKRGRVLCLPCGLSQPELASWSYISFPKEGLWFGFWVPACLWCYGEMATVIGRAI